MTVDTRISKVHLVHRLFWQAMDWIYPPRCAACSTPGVRLCSACTTSIKVIDQQRVCPMCGIPQTTTELCQECATVSPAFTALRSWGLYEGALREAIHKLKYRNDLGVSEELARPLSALLTGTGWHVDLISPVPLSRKRLKTRGYNQAAMIARWVSFTNRIPFYPGVMVRSKDTISQVGLSGEERRLNVLEAFEANPAIATGKSILVIDDVATTGATMQACALALLKSGASHVYGLTLARAGHIHIS